tara:strand:+ start:179 stop:358 length:180 start_codon:yes stop_codon:yes gene_type:complete
MTTPNDLTYEIEDEFENFRFNLQEFQRTSDQEHWFEAVKTLKYLVELVEELQSEVDQIN